MKAILLIRENSDKILDECKAVVPADLSEMIAAYDERSSNRECVFFPFLTFGDGSKSRSWAVISLRDFEEKFETLGRKSIQHDFVAVRRR